MCKNYSSLYSTKIDKINEIIFKILAELDFTALDINIYIKHTSKINEEKEHTTSYYNFDDAGVNYLIQSNSNKIGDKIYLKINEKYFKLKEDNLTKIRINLKSFYDIFIIEINNGFITEQFPLVIEKFLHEFFEGNTISGYDINSIKKLTYKKY